MSEKIAAILLAAGRSRRMGSCKQLLPLMEETVIAHCIGMLLGAGIKEIIVVVSPNGNEVATEARRFPVRVAVNRESEGDMASSVRAGRDALPVDVAGVVVALCDYPLVKSATVTQLIETHLTAPDRIVVPLHAGRKGHPLLFPKPVLDELHAPLTLRDIVRRDPDRIVERAVSDVGVVLDMDTPDDYRTICSMMTRQAQADNSIIPWADTDEANRISIHGRT